MHVVDTEEHVAHGNWHAEHTLFVDIKYPEGQYVVWLQYVEYSKYPLVQPEHVVLEM